MKKSTIIIVLLVIALIATNAFWLCAQIDAGISYTYQGVSLESNKEALAQALAIIRVTSDPDATREEIVLAAQEAASSSTSFEKEGYLWIGNLGLRFNEQGRLVEAVRAWDPP